MTKTILFLNGQPVILTSDEPDSLLHDNPTLASEHGGESQVEAKALFDPAQNKDSLETRLGGPEMLGDAVGPNLVQVKVSGGDGSGFMLSQEDPGGLHKILGHQVYPQKGEYGLHVLPTEKVERMEDSEKGLGRVESGGFLQLHRASLQSAVKKECTFIDQPEGNFGSDVFALTTNTELLHSSVENGASGSGSQENSLQSLQNLTQLPLVSNHLGVDGVESDESRVVQMPPDQGLQMAGGSSQVIQVGREQSQVIQVGGEESQVIQVGVEQSEVAGRDNSLQQTFVAIIQGEDGSTQTIQLSPEEACKLNLSHLLASSAATQDTITQLPETVALPVSTAGATEEGKRCTEEEVLGCGSSEAGLIGRAIFPGEQQPSEGSATAAIDDTTGDGDVSLGPFLLIPECNADGTISMLQIRGSDTDAATPEPSASEPMNPNSVLVDESQLEPTRELTDKPQPLAFPRPGQNIQKIRLPLNQTNHKPSLLKPKGIDWKNVPAKSSKVPGSIYLRDIAMRTKFRNLTSFLDSKSTDQELEEAKVGCLDAGHNPRVSAVTSSAISLQNATSILTPGSASLTSILSGGSATSTSILSSSPVASTSILSPVPSASTPRGMFQKMLDSAEGLFQDHQPTVRVKDETLVHAGQDPKHLAGDSAHMMQDSSHTMQSLAHGTSIQNLNHMMQDSAHMLQNSTRMMQDSPHMMQDSPLLHLSSLPTSSTSSSTQLTAGSITTAAALLPMAGDISGDDRALTIKVSTGPIFVSGSSPAAVATAASTALPSIKCTEYGEGGMSQGGTVDSGSLTSIVYCSPGGDDTPFTVHLPGGDSSKPLGSSENPIQLVQQGNTFQALQPVQARQLEQITSLLQQRRITVPSTTHHDEIYDPKTNMKIVYKVVYPDNILQPDEEDEEADCGREGEGAADGGPRDGRQCGPEERKKGRKGKDARKGKTGEDEDVDVEVLDEGESNQKSSVSVTRSGRISRPPRHMLKDFRHLPPTHFHSQGDRDPSTAGYLDYDHHHHKPPDPVSLELPQRKKRSVPKMTRLRYTCLTCGKLYMGRIEEHYAKFPDHRRPHHTLPITTAPQSPAITNHALSSSGQVVRHASDQPLVQVNPLASRQTYSAIKTLSSQPSRQDGAKEAEKLKNEMCGNKSWDGMDLAISDTGREGKALEKMGQVVASVLREGGEGREAMAGVEGGLEREGKDASDPAVTREVSATRGNGETTGKIINISDANQGTVKLETEQVGMTEPSGDVGKSEEGGEVNKSVLSPTPGTQASETSGEPSLPIETLTTLERDAQVASFTSGLVKGFEVPAEVKPARGRGRRGGRRGRRSRGRGARGGGPGRGGVAASSLRPPLPPPKPVNMLQKILNGYDPAEIQCAVGRRLVQNLTPWQLLCFQTDGGSDPSIDPEIHGDCDPGGDGSPETGGDKSSLDMWRNRLGMVESLLKECKEEFLKRLEPVRGSKALGNTEGDSEQGEARRDLGRRQAGAEGVDNITQGHESHTAIMGVERTPSVTVCGERIQDLSLGAGRFQNVAIEVGRSEAIIAPVRGEGSQPVLPERNRIHTIAMETDRTHNNLAMVTKHNHSVTMATEQAHNFAMSTEPSHNINMTTEQSQHVLMATKPSHSVSMSTETNHHILMATKPSHSVSMSTKPNCHILMATEPSHSSVSMSTEPNCHVLMATEPSHSVSMSTEPDRHILMAAEPSHSSVAMSTESNRHILMATEENHITMATNPSHNITMETKHSNHFTLGEHSHSVGRKPVERSDMYGTEEGNGRTTDPRLRGGGIAATDSQTTAALDNPGPVNDVGVVSSGDDGSVEVSEFVAHVLGVSGGLYHHRHHSMSSPTPVLTPSPGSDTSRHTEDTKPQDLVHKSDTLNLTQVKRPLDGDECAVDNISPKRFHTAKLEGVDSVGHSGGESTDISGMALTMFPGKCEQSNSVDDVSKVLEHATRNLGLASYGLQAHMSSEPSLAPSHIPSPIPSINPLSSTPKIHTQVLSGSPFTLPMDTEGLAGLTQTSTLTTTTHCLPSVSAATTATTNLPLDLPHFPGHNSSGISSCNSGISSCNSGILSCSPAMPSMNSVLTSCTSGMSCNVGISTCNTGIPICNPGMPSINSGISSCTTEMPPINSGISSCASGLPPCHPLSNLGTSLISTSTMDTSLISTSTISQVNPIHHTMPLGDLDITAEDLPRLLSEGTGMVVGAGGDSRDTCDAPKLLDSSGDTTDLSEMLFKLQEATVGITQNHHHHHHHQEANLVQSHYPGQIIGPPQGSTTIMATQTLESHTHPTMDSQGFSGVRDTLDTHPSSNLDNSQSSVGPSMPLLTFSGALDSSSDFPCGSSGISQPLSTSDEGSDKLSQGILGQGVNQGHGSGSTVADQGSLGSGRSPLNLNFSVSSLGSSEFEELLKR